MVTHAFKEKLHFLSPNLKVAPAVKSDFTTTSTQNSAKKHVATFFTEKFIYLSS